MTTSVKPIPDGYYGATPFLCCEDAARAIEFYQRAFGATETARLMQPDGKVGYAQIKIGDAPIMLADEFPEINFRSPRALGGTPVNIHLYVEDVDRLVEQAVAAGATLLKPVRDEFYGDRSGKLTDPFGHVWDIATHFEDVSQAEMQRRLDALFAPE